MTPEKKAALHKRCFETPRPWTAEEFRSLQRSDLVFLCEHEFGFALGRVAVDEAELLTLAVDPDQRRRGIASNLLRTFENVAIERKAVTTFLEVSAENDAALALYDATGYMESGRRPAYYVTPEGRRVDAVIMSKALVSA